MLYPVGPLLAWRKEVRTMAKKVVKIVIRKLDKVETTRQTVAGDG
jgi:hypothetical protein